VIVPRYVVAILSVATLGGCSVSSSPSVTGCAAHHGLERLERGEDQDGHTRPVLAVCRDGALVDIR
jgi:hypothetical protein